MKSLVVVLILLLGVCTKSEAQSNEIDTPTNGISLDLDLVIRSDDLDQEGAGPAFAIGWVKYLGDEGKYRLTPSIEYGAFKWEQDDLYYDYYSLNLIASMDLFKWGRYSIPMSGGIVIDYTKDQNGDSRIKEAYKLFFGSRIDLRSNWAIEFLNFGLIINQDFFSMKTTYLRAEYQF